MDRIADVAGLIVVAAIVGVVVGSPNTRGQIQALTNGFSDVLRAATSAGRR
jgi:type III secretory pathway component EscS